jgi:hypothetical protein
MLTDSVFSRLTRPWPAQARHGFSIVWPEPWQEGQVRSIVKNPCCARTRPWPWQVRQVTGREPGSAPLPLQASQWTKVATRIAVCLPLKASSSETSRL